MVATVATPDRKAAAAKAYAAFRLDTPLRAAEINLSLFVIISVTAHPESLECQVHESFFARCCGLGLTLVQLVFGFHPLLLG